MNQDVYLWLEDLSSQETLRWAEKQDLVARRVVARYGERLYARFVKLYEEPIYYFFKVSLRGYFYMYRSRDYRVGIVYRDGETEDLVISSRLGRKAIITNYYIDDGGECWHTIIQ
ncbi:MAG: hypothetical protein RQ885_13260 [Desulfurococcales archaeon]|jgi:prolyl oligopeptidase PreP (S9A serine peptidase family)|nr:hypothetical protein [Desulfurococcales archaeon]MDT7889926.1 hypothetical protein [Desulfurococcales archaeon]